MALEISSSFPLLSLSVALLSIILFMSMNMKRKRSRSTIRLPPGTMGLPWIGETMEFYKAQQKNQIFNEFVRPRIQRYGEVFKTRLMGTPTIIVNGPEANKFFMTNEFKLVVSSWPSSSVQLMGKDCIMAKEGDQHRLLRGLIASSLNGASLESLVPRICNTVKIHLDTEWDGQENISLYRSTKSLTFNIVFESLLGTNVNSMALEIFEKVLKGVFCFPFRFPGSTFRLAERAREVIGEMLGDIVRRKKVEMEGRVEGGEDEGILLSRLVGGMVRGEISEEEVTDNVVLLIFAAHDTTSFSIAMIFRMLADHPDCYFALLQEHMDIMRNKRPGENLTMDDIKKMKYTWQVARESMRLFPPIFGSFRKAITDIQYEGFTIPKGWKVMWTAYGTHYDEQYFQEPMRFNPSRFEEPIPPYVFVPFGGGPRVCVGYQLAKLNILIFLHYVVTRYDWSLLYPDEPITSDPLPFPSKGMPIKISAKLL